MNINRKEFVEEVTKLLGGGLLAELDAETLWLFHCELNSVQKKDRAEAAYRLSQVQKEALNRAEQRQKVVCVPENGGVFTITQKEPSFLVGEQDGYIYEIKNIKTGAIRRLAFSPDYWDGMF